MSNRKRLRSVSDEEGSVPAPRKSARLATEAASIGNRSDNVPMSNRKRLRSVTDKEGTVPAPRKSARCATKAVSIGNRSDNDRSRGKILSDTALIQEVSKMIKNKEKAEVMILELMMKYSFNLSHLKHLLGSKAN
jgi:hypothetical protein